MARRRRRRRHAAVIEIAIGVAETGVEIAIAIVIVTAIEDAAALNPAEEAEVDDCEIAVVREDRVPAILVRSLCQ